MTSVASGDSLDAAPPARPMRNLDIALVGNGRIGALIDADASIVWACFPRFDGDPVFCALLDTAAAQAARGLWSLELVDGVASTKTYVDNTAVLVTRLTDRAGGSVEITDCAPRFRQHGRLHQPTTIMRRIVRLAEARASSCACDRRSRMVEPSPSSPRAATMSGTSVPISRCA